MNRMTCPCCGGSIELENDAESACDTCAAFMSAGVLMPDPGYTKEGEDE